MKNKAKKEATGYFKQFLLVIQKGNLPWFWLALSFAANVVANYFTLELPQLTASLLGGNLSNEALRNCILYYVLFAVVLCGQTTILAITTCLGTRNARNRLWNKMLNLPVRYYDEKEPSERMSSVTNDLLSAMPNLIRLLVSVVPDIWYVCAALKRVSEYHTTLMLGVVVFFPVKYVYSVILGRSFYKVQVSIFNEIGGLTGFLAERISNLPLIKAFTKEDLERGKGETAAKGLFKAEMRGNKISAVDQAVRTVITLGEQVVVMILAVILLQQGKIVIEQWVAFFLFFQEITMRFDALIAEWLQVKNIQGTVARTAEMLEVPEEPIEDDGTAVSAVPAGDISFDHVTFSYGDKCALRDVSFTVPKGSMTAIVGLCGSGKTTSLSLLERFYAPDSGQVYLGGQPVGEMPLAEYRRCFAYVEQNPEVFSGTVREALTYGLRREISDEELWKAAKTSGFSDYLERQPSGLDTAVSSGGNSLSGGERQKLVLTREFLRGAEILLLDEPTSALDAKTSKMVQETILNLFRGKTVLIVTHDLHLLEDMDQIIVLQDSCLAGSGTYAELMESCGLFREMIETQEHGEEVRA